MEGMEYKMAEFRNTCGSSRDRDMVCIDAHRVLDSCRDKDCFEDVRVYLTCIGQEIIERTSVVRAKCAKVVWSNINIESVPFNKGIYQLFIKIYTKITFEACIGPGNIQEFEGVGVVEKKVILFGGEGNVNVFKSGDQSFCPNSCGVKAPHKPSSLPIAVLEVVDPIILNTKVQEPHRPCKCCCCCTIDEIPDCVCANLSHDLVDTRDSSVLTVSLGFFSVVRIERPAQYLVNAVEYSVPEKECVLPAPDDPCSLFKKMAFPVAEFSTSCGIAERGCAETDKKCGC